MFDAHFRVRPEFLRDSAALRRRLRAAAALNAAMSPFLLVFLLIHFFMKNAEAIYHQPSSIGEQPRRRQARCISRTGRQRSFCTMQVPGGGAPWHAGACASSTNSPTSCGTA
jgi:hypothetical protein